MDINEIKAGEYQLVAVRWDERTSKPGEPFTFRRHRRGDKVRLSEADAKRLVMAGAVVKPGELEQQAADAARRQYRALLARMPDELRQQLLTEDAEEAQAALANLQEVAGITVGDNQVLDGIVGEVDLVEAVAGLDEEQRAELAAALAAVEAGDAESESEPKRPPQTANKTVWLEFRGMSDLTEEQADAITVKQLQDDAFMASYQRPAANPGGQPGSGA